MAKRSPLAKWLRRQRRRLDARLQLRWLLEAVSWLAARRIRKWQAQISWKIEGQADLEAALADGPVILVVWHGRLAMTPAMWRAEWGAICSLTSQARPGQIVAKTLARFGWVNASMHDTQDNRAVSLQVARLIRSGTSIGIACDGPIGPARKMKTVPLDWARLTGAPIWLWSYSTENLRHLNAWDRMVLPRAPGQGVMLYRPWSQTVPKRPDPALLEGLRKQLETDLDDLTRCADQRMGHADIVN